MTLRDPFEEGEKLWVQGADGTRPAVYVGTGEASVFLGGPPLVYVVLEDTGQRAAVELDRITRRD